MALKSPYSRPLKIARALILSSAAVWSICSPAQTVALKPIGPAAASSDIQMSVNKSVTLDAFTEASVAFAVNPDIVEVNTFGGKVVLLARRSGNTLVTVILPGRMETIRVQVQDVAAPLEELEYRAGRPGASLESGYDWYSQRLSTGLDFLNKQGDETTRVRIYGIHQPGSQGREALWALQGASVEFASPGRSLTLLDRTVEGSALTLSGTALRGVHLLDGPLRLHAGLIGLNTWKNLIEPSSDGNRAVAVSYALESSSVALVPALLWLPDSKSDTPGVVAFGLKRGTLRDPWEAQGELGWSGKPGASAKLTFREAERQLWMQGTTRPAGFASPSGAGGAQTYMDASWLERVDAVTTGSATLSGSRLEVGDKPAETVSLRMDWRHRFSPNWNINAGASRAGYSSNEQSTRSNNAALGVGFNQETFGVAALYRYEETSASDRGGHGGRLTLDGKSGGFTGSVNLDVQQQAPTMDLLVQNRPDLAAVLAELGLVTGRPEAVIRQVRDNANLLAERGVSLGPLRLDPLRLQAGFDMSWRAGGVYRPELGLRFAVDESQGLASINRSFLSNARAAWRIWGNTNLQVNYARWVQKRDGLPTQTQSSLQFMLSVNFSGFTLPGSGRSPITGVVLRDDRSMGSPSADASPMADVEIVLDGARRTRTDAQGRFSFDAPGVGDHLVEAQLPPLPGAYFTAPSSVTLPAGGAARFGVTLAAARLSGRVRSDAGLPIPGIRVRLEGPASATTATDPTGAYVLTSPPGAAQISLVAESFPPGYDLTALPEINLELTRGSPAVRNFIVRAQRSLAGVITAKNPTGLKVSADGLGRSVTPDANGRFLLRGLPAGPLTLVVEGANAQVRQTVNISSEAGSVTKIELQVP